MSKTLNAYLSIVEPHLLAQVGGKAGELICLLKEEKLLSEKEVMQRVCGEKHNRSYYRNLKHRTIKILQALAIVTTPKGNNEVLEKIRECRKIYFSAMNFIEIGERREAHKLLIQAYNIAVEYGLTQLAYCSVIQLMVDASLNRQPTKFKHFSKKKKELLLDLQAEDLAEEYYCKITLNVNAKRGLAKNKFEEYIRVLNQFTCTSTKFIQYYYMICTLKNSNTTQYKTVIKDTQKALRILKNRKGVFRSVLQLLIKHKAFAHIALGEYEPARKLYLEAEQCAPPRSFNIGIVYYMRAINALHSGAYQEAYDLYRQHRKTKWDTLREQWVVLGAYLYFLKNVGELKTGKDRFSLGKYLNETTAVAHDKLGNNINVLIGELLVLLIKNRGKFIDRVDAINNYSYQYLRGEDTRRAKWFIRILCMMPRANFHPIALARMAKRQMDNLEKYPIALGDNLSVEIVPFEALLKMAVQQLERKTA